MRIIASLVAAASVLLLAGCASLFPPDPTAAPPSVATRTPTPVAGPCAPQNSTFEWSAAPATEQDFEAISTQYETFGEHPKSGIRSAGGVDISVRPDALSSPIFADIEAHPAEWDAALMPSLTGSDIVPDGFGQVSGLSGYTSAQFDPPRPHTGSWVRVTVAPVITLGMVVRCEDGSGESGIIFAPIPSGSIFVLHCDSRLHPRDSAQQSTARAQCDVAG